MFHDDIGDLLVLLGDARLGVNDEHRDVATNDGILRALHAEKLDGVIHAARFAHAGGVDQNIFLPHAFRFHLEGHVNGIARGARNGRNDDAFGIGERVDDGGFAHVGATDDGQLEG